MEDIQHVKKVKEVIIIGASGHAAEIDDYINYYNELQNKNEDKLIIRGFLDDDKDNYLKYKFSGPYIGGIKSHIVDEACEYVIAIATVKNKIKIINFLLDKGAKFTSFIHPSAFISKSATLGKGVVIAPNVNVGPNVKIGDFNLINSRASIGHDSIIGNYNFITPNVCFSGFTEIGNENMFGINSATIPNIQIGSRNIIAAGMIIDKNIKNDNTVFYRFKEKIIIIKS